MNPKQEFIDGISNRIMRKLDVIEISILRELWKEQPDHDKLIEMLKVQQKDNEGVLVAVTGYDLGELLKKINL